MKKTDDDLLIFYRINMNKKSENILSLHEVPLLLRSDGK